MSEHSVSMLRHHRSAPCVAQCASLSVLTAAALRRWRTADEVYSTHDEVRTDPCTDKRQGADSPQRCEHADSTDLEERTRSAHWRLPLLQRTLATAFSDCSLTPPTRSHPYVQADELTFSGAHWPASVVEE
jgi:hypothetical protein